MGFVQRFERKLEDAVGDAFARVFGGKVVPTEVGSALQREAGDGLRKLEGGHKLAPNRYVITVGESDQQQLASDHEMTTGALARQLRGYIADQGWETYGDVSVEFEVSPTLHTGQFRTAGSVDPDAGSARARSRAQRDAPAARISPPGAGQMTQEPGNDRGRGQATPTGNQARGDAPYGEDSYNEEVGYNGAYRQQEAYNDPRYAQQGYPGGAAQQQSYGHAGQAYGDQQYGGQSYGEQGYSAQAYADQGYADAGYAEQGYAAQGYAGQEYAGQDYAGQAYGDPRYAQQGYAGEYGSHGYTGADYGDQGSATQVYGSYAPQGNWGSAQTAVLHLEDGSGRTYQLRDGSNVIGRGQEAHFRLPDTGVSRRHADIRWDGHVALLTDLGSTNGTTVNGAPVQDWQLAEGDVVHIGHSEIVIRFR